MAATAVLAVLLSLHACGFFLTVLRIRNRINYFIWFDDGLAVVAGLGGLLMGAILYASATLSPLQPNLFRISIVVYFVVIWISRTSLAMASGRLMNRRNRLRFSVFAISLVTVGIGYGVATAYMCKSSHQFCKLPHRLVVPALAMDIIVDVGVIFMNGRAVAVVTRLASISVARKCIVLSGLSSSICTLTINILFWAFYLTHDPEAVVLQSLYFANGVVIVGIIACNASVIAGVISRSFEDQAIPIIEIQVTQMTVLGTPLPAPSTVVASTVIYISSPAALEVSAPVISVPIAPAPVAPLSSRP